MEEGVEGGHVVVLPLGPVLRHPEEHGRRQRLGALLVREDAHDSCPALDLAEDPLKTVRRADQSVVRRRERRVRQGLVEAARERRYRLRVEARVPLSKAGGQRLGRLPTCSLEDRLEIGSDTLCLALRDMGEHVALEVDRAPLPRGPREFDLDGGLDRVVVVGDHQLDAAEPALNQALQEPTPGLGPLASGRLDGEHLAVALVGDPDRDEERDIADGTGPARFEVRRIEIQVGVRPLLVELAAAPLREHLIETGGDAAHGVLRDPRPGTASARHGRRPAAAKMMDLRRRIPSVDRVLGRGEAKTSIVTQRGIQVDVRVVAADQLGAALLYSTAVILANLAADIALPLLDPRRERA